MRIFHNSIMHQLLYYVACGDVDIVARNLLTKHIICYSFPRGWPFVKSLKPTSMNRNEISEISGVALTKFLNEITRNHKKSLEIT